MKFAFIDEEKARGRWRRCATCSGVSRSGYYAWKGRRPRQSAEDATLVVEIKAAYKSGRGGYGSPRVHRELRQKGAASAGNASSG